MLKKKILIVDDNPPNIQLIGNILKEKYVISFAQSGQEALDRIANTHFDLILLDIMMPGMDGFEVCNHLRASAETFDLPIILISAKAEKKSVVKGLELGADDYIVKPIDASDLLLRIRQQLDNKRKVDPETRRQQAQIVNKQLGEGIHEMAFWTDYSLRHGFDIQLSRNGFPPVKEIQGKIDGYQERVAGMLQAIQTREGKLIVQQAKKLSAYIEESCVCDTIKSLFAIPGYGSTSDYPEKSVDIRDVLLEIVEEIPYYGPGFAEIKVEALDDFVRSIPYEPFLQIISGILYDVERRAFENEMDYSKFRILIQLRQDINHMKIEIHVDFAEKRSNAPSLEPFAFLPVLQDLSSRYLKAGLDVELSSNQMVYHLLFL